MIKNAGGSWYTANQLGVALVQFNRDGYLVAMEIDTCIRSSLPYLFSPGFQSVVHLHTVGFMVALVVDLQGRLDDKRLESVISVGQVG